MYNNNPYGPPTGYDPYGPPPAYDPYAPYPPQSSGALIDPYRDAGPYSQAPYTTPSPYGPPPAPDAPYGSPSGLPVPYSPPPAYTNPAPYSQPYTVAPPYMQTYAASPPSSGSESGALALGIISLSLTVIGFGFFPAVLCTLAIICGIIGICLSVSARKERASGKATAGLTMSIIGLVLSVIFDLYAICACAFLLSTL